MSKPTVNGQRELADHARKIAERVAAVNPSTAAFYRRVAEAHEAEAERIQKGAR